MSKTTVQSDFLTFQIFLLGSSACFLSISINLLD